MQSTSCERARAQIAYFAYLIYMESENTQAAGADETARECSKCGEFMLYTIANWPATNGKAIGTVCRLCARNRKRGFDGKYRGQRVAARTQSLASLAGALAAPASEVVVSQAKDVLKVEGPLRRLEIAKALRSGATRINEHAGTVLDTVFEYAADKTSPHHEWALKLIAERVIPKKLYEDLGAQEAGIDAGAAGSHRPSVTIIVQPAASPAPVADSRVIEGVVIRESEG